MFKHSVSSAESGNAQLPPKETPVTPEKIATPAINTTTTPDIIRELLEKNLKWSQIIYEQNRKLNRKLLWGAVAGWVRVLIIIAPLVAAIIFLPPLWKEFKNKYSALFSVGSPSGAPGGALTPPSRASIEQFLNILPLTPAQKEQLKLMLK